MDYEYQMTKHEWSLFNSQKKIDQIYSQYKIYCKRCGHSIAMPYRVNKCLCEWCGKYVFRTKKDEFIYRLKERMHR